MCMKMDYRTCADPYCGICEMIREDWKAKIRQNRIEQENREKKL